MEQLWTILGQFDSAQAGFYSWTLALMIGVPVLLLLLSEWIERWQRHPDGSRGRLVGAIANFRNLVLPLLSLRLILQYILQVDSTSLSVRVVETMLWMMLLYSCLSVITQLVRSPGSVAVGEIAMPRVWGELLRMGLVLGVGFYVLGALWGAPMDQIVAALGVGSIVIGFALQDTLSSLVAGLLLAFEKPFQVGHWLRQGGYEGQVIEMNWRAVRLRTRERDIVVVPNALMGKESVVNMTLTDPLHAELIPVSFAYVHPPNHVKRVLMEICLATPGVIHDPAPHIRVIGYAYDKVAINYEIKLFIIDYLRTEFIRDEILTRVYYAAQRYNLQLPYTTNLFYQRDSSELTRRDDFPARLQQLSTLPYFAVQPPPVLEQLARHAEFHRFGAEEWILPVGAFFTGFYILLEGEVRLVIPEHAVELSATAKAHSSFHSVAPAATALTANRTFGPTRLPWRELTRLNGGDFFGELMLRRDHPSPYAIEVTQDALALFVSRSHFIQIVETNPRLAMEMNQLIEDRAKLLQRAGDGETRRQEDKETGRQGDGEIGGGL